MGDALRLIDLFAGAGGMTEGFRRSKRFKVVAAVELDRAAAATYGLNHGFDHLWQGDIADWLHNGRVPKADVIIGGPPCQGFSSLGRQDIADVRNKLWMEYARAIHRAQPSFFVFENVGTFLKSVEFEHFSSWTRPGQLLHDYALEAWILNARDYGSYQNRRRTVIIGRRGHVAALGTPRLAPDRVTKTVRDAWRGIAEEPTARNLPSRVIESAGEPIPGPFYTHELHLSRHYEPVSLERFRHIPAGGNRFDLPEELKAPCWRGHTSGSADVMGRLRWGKPSVTIRTEFFKPEKGRYLHPEADRAITHLEAALLQGFPLDYRWAGSKSSIARQIGNAVPVELAHALALHIADAAGLAGITTVRTAA